MTAEEKESRQAEIRAAIIHDHMSTIGGRGGKVMHDRKRAAIMKNLQKAHRARKQLAKNKSK
jgi:hypothetical protein